MICATFMSDLLVELNSIEMIITGFFGLKFTDDRFSQNSTDYRFFLPKFYRLTIF